MAKDDYEPMEEQDILVTLEKNIASAVGYYDSELSREREKVTEYYNAVLPKPAHDGNSKYVSQDVYDAVEAMKAALLETFSAGNKIVKFSPQGPEDVELAAVCTSYTDYCLFRMNDGYSIFSNAIHDGLTSRVGVAKVFWDVRSESYEEDFENLTQDELDILLAADDIELVESNTESFDENEDLISGTIKRIYDTSQVCIESVAPEEFIIEPQSKSIDTDFCAHRTRKSLSELREMGFDEDKLEKIGSDNNDTQLDTDPEVIARFNTIGADKGYDSHGYQDQVRQVMVYECYINLDVDGTGIAELHKVIKAGNQILEIEKANRRPFVVFCPLPIPHSFYGSNFADRVIATQNARTVLTRSILDHAVLTNNPRYLVVKGGLTNPRELISNKVGGLVNVSRPDAVVPMPQASLNPFVFQTLKQLDEDKEDSTGVSRLSTGTNKDAVSKQNSAAMIEQLASMSQQRQKIIARNFANQFVKPLFHAIYQLVVENEDKQKIVDLAGKFVQINPAVWNMKRDVVTELRLGYGEQDREAQKFLALHQLMSTDPSLQPIYNIKNRYEMLKSVLQQQGILNADEYLTDPSTLPPPKPDPTQQMQMQMAGKQLELQERQTVVAEQKAQTDAQVQTEKLRLEAMRAQASHSIASDKLDLNEEQLAHKQRIDEAELQVLRNTEDVRGIASPRG